MDRDEAMALAFKTRVEAFSSEIRAGNPADIAVRTSDEAFLASLDASGWAVVRKEPTVKMLEAGEDSFFTTYTGTLTSTPSAVWSAMLAASQDKK